MAMDTFELREWESTTFESLTVKNLWGGHKISRGESGGRGGDLTYANLECVLHGDTRYWMAYHPQANEDEMACLDLSPYRIRIISVGWNGEHARFAVEKFPTNPA